jgi:hypothetical protein
MKSTSERLTPYRMVRCPHCGHSHDLSVPGAVRLVPSDDGGLHLPCHQCGKWLLANPLSNENADDPDIWHR